VFIPTPNLLPGSERWYRAGGRRYSSGYVFNVNAIHARGVDGMEELIRTLDAEEIAALLEACMEEGHVD
jgi:hypothetical protein